MAEKTTTSKDFFLWLAAIAALYISVGSLIALVFEYINRLFGDPSTYIYDVYSTGISVAIASLIIVFPLYILITRMLNQDIRRHPEKKELWVRRWLLVFTLFVAGAAMVIDLIVLIQHFLGGEEFTLAFILKVLTVLVVAGGAFLYYLHDLRGTWEKNEPTAKGIGAGVSVVVLLLIIAGFFIMGSPQTQRMLRYDQERIQDLQNLQWRITDYWQQREELPASLGDMEDPLSGFVVPVDPETGEPYDYRVVNQQNLTFELCATLALASPEGASAARPRAIEPYSSDVYWEHDAGRTCFERTIDPEQFPPRSALR